jgi:hypothetical protein
MDATEIRIRSILEQYAEYVRYIMTRTSIARGYSMPLYGLPLVLMDKDDAVAAIMAIFKGGEEEMKLPDRVEKCQTHHTACPCRERRYERMASALKVIRIWCDFEGGIEGDPGALARLCDAALKGEGDEEYMA